nr:hypothetical protein [Candidatus Aquicultor secundus]
MATKNSCVRNLISLAPQVPFLAINGRVFQPVTTAGKHQQMAVVDNPVDYRTGKFFVVKGVSTGWGAKKIPVNR